MSKSLRNENSSLEGYSPIIVGRGRTLGDSLFRGYLHFLSDLEIGISSKVCWAPALRPIKGVAKNKTFKSAAGF